MRRGPISFDKAARSQPVAGSEERPGLTHDPWVGGLGGSGAEGILAQTVNLYSRPICLSIIVTILSSNLLILPCVSQTVVKSTIIKRSIAIDGRKTSIGIEDDYWNSLQEIAHQRNETVSRLVTRIDAERKFANLSSAIRLFVLGFYQDQYNSTELVDLAPEDA
jgi:predicted DNA-binding ribbon-helix-helix protein